MNSSKRQLVYVLDDHKVYRNLVAHYLSKTTPYLVRKFNRAQDLLDKIHMKPDVVILDYHLEKDDGTEESGIDILKKIKEENGESYVIMLTKDDNTETAVNCIKAGAFDYVVKNESAFVRIQNTINNICQVIYAKNIAESRRKMLTLFFWVILLAMLLYLILFLILESN